MLRQFNNSSNQQLFFNEEERVDDLLIVDGCAQPARSIAAPSRAEKLFNCGFTGPSIKKPFNWSKKFNQFHLFFNWIAFVELELWCLFVWVCLLFAEHWRVAPPITAQLIKHQTKHHFIQLNHQINPIKSKVSFELMVDWLGPGHQSNSINFTNSFHSLFH